MNFSKQTTLFLLFALSLLLTGYTESATANRSISIDTKRDTKPSVISVLEPDAFSWYFTYEVTDEGEDYSIDPVHEGYPSFRVVQVTQLRDGNKVLREAKDTLPCVVKQSAQDGNIPNPVKFTFFEDTEKWLLQFNGDAAIACRSVDIRKTVLQLHNDYCIFRPCAEVTFDICEEQGVVPCSITVEDVFVDAQVDTSKQGTIFSYESLRFSTYSRKNDIKIQLHDQIAGFTALSPWIPSSTGYLNYIRIEQVDGGFKHHLNGQATFVASMNQSYSSFLSAPPVNESEFNIYFGYNPDTGEYMTDGSMANGIFDPYSSCGCGGY